MGSSADGAGEGTDGERRIETRPGFRSGFGVRLFCGIFRRKWFIGKEFVFHRAGVGLGGEFAPSLEGGLALGFKKKRVEGAEVGGRGAGFAAGEIDDMPAVEDDAGGPDAGEPLPEPEVVTPLVLATGIALGQGAEFGDGAAFGVEFGGVGKAALGGRGLEAHGKLLSPITYRLLDAESPPI